MYRDNRRPRHGLIVVALAFALGLALPACTTWRVDEGPAPGVHVRDKRAPNAGVRMDTVAILDPSLAHWRGPEDERYSAIAIERNGARRTTTGTVQVYATIRNRSTVPLAIEARCQFFDAEEVPVEAPSAWTRIFLTPKGVEHYKESSTQIQDVAHYYVEIREAR
jgi:hypothetical protein